MDTEYKIPASMIKDFESIVPASLNEDEMSKVQKYVLLTRERQESKQFFEVFIFNLNNLRICFDLKSGDTAVMSSACPPAASEYIALNALVTNYISAGKSVAEYTRASAKRIFDGCKDGEDPYNIYVSEQYDSSKSYRFLMNLRNFVQHTGMPLSLREGRYAFDVAQILDTPHFNMNDKFKIDLKDFLEKFDLGDKVPCLAMTITIAEFTAVLVDIYRKYISCINPKIAEAYRNIKSIVRKNPSLLCKTHKCFKNHIIYELENGYHAVNIKDDPTKAFESFDKYLEEIYLSEKKAYDEIRACFIPF